MQLGSSYPLIRKDSNTGKARTWRIETAQLRIQMKPVSYLDLEAQACTLFGRLTNPVGSSGDGHDSD